MRYLLLIYADEKGPAKTPDEQAAIMDAWFKYSEALQQSGKMQGGNALQPTATATTVRGDTGKKHLRRALRRDERAARRLLRDRCE
jgi:hypothetical protein